MRTWQVLGILAGCVCAVAAVGAVAYSAGWHAAQTSAGTTAALASAPDDVLPDATTPGSPFAPRLPMSPALPSPRPRLQPAPPIQELIPLPGPGQQLPGQQPQPGQDEECEARVYLFHNGRFYQMRPGPGPGPDGQPGGPQELIPLQPVPGIPGMPAPGTPFAPGLPSPPPGQRF
ncbi:MAG: hypothetical protein QN163_10260 [Armatimonadota bacterium]|nr:hypothetical protein [Armatimonadota bacterium]MDR5696775.1 hypothetical protein [Armatimonadota bacterium]